MATSASSLEKGGTMGSLRDKEERILTSSLITAQTMSPTVSRGQDFSGHHRGSHGSTRSDSLKKEASSGDRTLKCTLRFHHSLLAKATLFQGYSQKTSEHIRVFLPNTGLLSYEQKVPRGSPHWPAPVAALESEVLPTQPSIVFSLFSKVSEQHRTLQKPLPAAVPSPPFFHWSFLPEISCVPISILALDSQRTWINTVRVWTHAILAYTTFPSSSYISSRNAVPTETQPPDCRTILQPLTWGMVDCQGSSLPPCSAATGGHISYVFIPMVTVIQMGWWPNLSSQNPPLGYATLRETVPLLPIRDELRAWT